MGIILSPSLSSPVSEKFVVVGGFVAGSPVEIFPLVFCK